MMCDVLHATKWVMQNVWHKLCHMLHEAKCVTCYMRQNAWHNTWHKMHDMLHDAKCVTCFMGEMHDMLLDTEWVSCYMTPNSWHVTWYKMCHVLHEATCVSHVKYVIFTWHQIDSSVRFDSRVNVMCVVRARFIALEIKS